MKKPKPNLTTHNLINLPEARRAMSALLPHLPETRVGEWLTVRGLRLPDYEALAAPNALPILDQPGALLEGLGPFPATGLPMHWMDACEEQKRRQIRSTQLLRLHAACLRAETEDARIPDLADCDSVVAGLLLLVARPCQAQLREALVCRAVTSPFGAYLAAHGMLIEDEHARALDAIAGDPRIASALCRRDPVAAGNLPKRLFRSYDLWSAAVQLNRAEAGLWLRGVVAQAVADPVAAITALTLQPGAGDPAARRWVAVLVKSKPLFAYEAVRWSRWTWILPRWENLRDQLQDRATSDLGCSWFHWYRDVRREQYHEALRNESVEILWAAELIHATKDFGHALRRRCVLRLNSNPADLETKLALRWLNQRRRPR
ncbi:MAG: hypothetical protein ABR924_17665 [Terracidiphilus sp.]